MTKRSFNWEDFFILGNSFINETDESKLRTGINRFYFSSFCKSRDCLINNNVFLDENNKKILKSKKGSVHYETQKTFRKHPRFKKNGVKFLNCLKN